MKYSISRQALIASIALLVTPVAHSAVYVANNSGNWSNSGIWSPNSVPDPGQDDITISSGFSILADAVPPSSFDSVAQNNAHTITITGAGSTLTSHDYVISHGSTTTVTNGGVLNLNGYLFGGNIPGGDPSVLNVDAATVYVALTPFGDPTPVRGFTGTQVGINSEFRINITNGGQYLIYSRENGWVKVGMTSGATGTISVDGTGSIFSRDYSEPLDLGRVENITVGEVGGATGNVYLKNGGALTDNMNLVIAQNGGSTGNVIVGGDNNGAAGTGILTISKNIILGDGAGTFIQHGGTTTTGVAGVGGTFVVGFGNGSASVATINGGAVNVGGELMIAQNGGSTGTVNLNGGTTSVDYVIIGSGTGALNFNGGVLRANKDEADFLRNISASNSEILAGGVIFDSNGHNITINTALDGAGGLTKDGLGALTLTGSSTYSGSTIVDEGTLIVGGSNVIPNASAVTITLGTTLDLNDNNETIGSLTGAGSVTLGAGTLTTGGNNASTTFTGVISESGSLVKDGTGVLILSGANSYAGSTTVSVGVLNLQNNSALGTAAGGTSVAGGAAIQMQGGITITDEALTLSGSGIANDGALRNISGDNNYNGNITLGADTRINSDANTLTINPASGNAISGGFALVIGGEGNVVIGAPVTNGGGLTKDGNGTLTLTDANAYTGSTSILDGVVNIQHGDALGSSLAGTSVDAGAALQIQGGITVANESIFLNGTGVSNDGALRSMSGNNSFNGAITLGSDSRIHSETVGDTLTIDPLSGNAISGAFNLTFGGAGNILIGGPVANGGTVTKTGTGTTTFTDANTYTGLTNINQGILNIQNGGGLGTSGSGTVVVDGSALQLQGNITVTGEALTISGLGVANDGALRSVSGNNSYNGNITLGSDSRINSDTIGNTLTIDPASGNAISGAFDIIFGGAGNIVVGSPVANGGDVTKDGSGTLTFTDSNSYTGTTLINDGVLNVQNGGGLGATGAGTTVTTGAALQLQGGITIAGEALTINGTGESNDGALRSMSGNNSFNGNITLGSDSQINSETVGQTLTIDPASGNAVSGAFDIIFGGAGNIVVGAPVANGGDVTKDGNGTLTFTDSNSFTGTTFINDGVLNIQNGGALGGAGAGTVVADGAALQLQGDITVTGEALTISGMGVSNDGALRSLSGNNSFNGNITLGADSRINSDTVGQTLTLDPASGNAIEGAFDVIFGGAGNIVVGAPVANGGDVTKDGNGTLTFTDSNSFTGITFINDGVLNIQNGGALGGAGAGTVVANGAALQLQGGITVIGEALTINGTGESNDGALRSVSGNNNFNGNITLGSDSRINSDTIGDTLTIDPASGNAISGVFDIIFGGAGNIVVGAPVANGGDVTKDGNGTLTFTDSNTYTGTTFINDGVLNVQNGGGLGATGAGTVVADGAALQLQGNIIITDEPLTISGMGVANDGALRSVSGDNSFNGNIVLGADSRINSDTVGDTLTIDPALGNAISGAFDVFFGGAGNILVGAPIANGGDLNKDGTGILTLDAINTYTGDTNIYNGTILISGGGPINSNAIPDLSDVFIDMLGTFNLNNHNETIGSLSGSGNVILGSGTLTTGGNNADTTFSGSISGTGGLIKEGDGTFTLSGVNTYTGDTTVNDGVLVVTGSIVSNVNVGAGGTLGGNGTFGGTTTVSGILGDPDSTGEMIFDGDLVLLGTAVLNMQIGGTLASQYDHLTLNANFTIDGTLNVTLINGFSPVPGNSFDLFDFNPLNTTGTFDAINLPGLPFDFTWDVSDLYDTGVLAVVPEPSTFGLLALGSVIALRRRRK